METNIHIRSGLDECYLSIRRHLGSIHIDDPRTDLFQINSRLGHANDWTFVRIATSNPNDIRILFLDIRRLFVGHR